MRRSCAALALAVLTAGTCLAAEGVPAPLVPVAVPHEGCGANCGGSCLHRLCDWMTYRALPVSPCCRIWITPRYCHPPTNTYFIATCPRNGSSACAAHLQPAPAPRPTCAVNHASAPPAGDCRTGSCGGPFLGGWHLGQTFAH
jgi:hypothetical protein